MKWNESGFRPPLCTYRLNWARRTSWGWWDDWDDTVLQTQDSKFEPWRSEAEHATSRSRRLPAILTFTRGWGRNIFCFFQTAETGNRTPNSGVKGSGANHYPRAPALERCSGVQCHVQQKGSNWLLASWEITAFWFRHFNPSWSKIEHTGHEWDLSLEYCIGLYIYARSRHKIEIKPMLFYCMANICDAAPH